MVELTRGGAGRRRRRQPGARSTGAVDEQHPVVVGIGDKHRGAWARGDARRIGGPWRRQVDRLAVDRPRKPGERQIAVAVAIALERDKRGVPRIAVAHELEAGGFVHHLCDVEVVFDLAAIAGAADLEGQTVLTRGEIEADLGQVDLAGAVDDQSMRIGAVAKLRSSGPVGRVGAVELPQNLGGDVLSVVQYLQSVEIAQPVAAPSCQVGGARRGGRAVYGVMMRPVLQRHIKR
jgi:hypothetical protein